MDFGIEYFPTEDAIQPADIARTIEERGLESVFFAEHTHIPASRETPYSAGELPRKYSHMYDLFVAVTAAVTATSRVRVGSGICLATQRHPITTAKEVASVDRISGGRFEFGVGAGWLPEEMDNHGIDRKRRMKRFEEHLAAIKTIWSEPEATFHGDFVNFERIWSWPKPSQRPGPPILVAGDGPTVIDRVLRLGDGWFPAYDGDQLLPRITELHERATRQMSVSVLLKEPDPAVLEKLSAVGCTRAVYWIPTGGRSVVEPALDRWEQAIAEFTGEA